MLGNILPACGQSSKHDRFPILWSLYLAGGLGVERNGFSLDGFTVEIEQMNKSHQEINFK